MMAALVLACTAAALRAPPAPTTCSPTVRRRTQAVVAFAQAPSLQRPLMLQTKTLRQLRGGGEGAAMSAAAIAERVCPAVGFVLSNALYYSPVPKLNECVGAGSLGSLNPLPSALVVVSATAWVGFALSVRNPWIAATNVPGAMVGFYQLVTMLPLMRGHPDLGKVQATILAGAASALALWAALIFGGAGAAARALWLGNYASLICILLFASPLSTIATVVRTRDAASILAPLTAAQVANCLMWTLYGLTRPFSEGLYIWGPNGTGLLLGLAQLALKLLFPSKAAAAG